MNLKVKEALPLTRSQRFVEQTWKAPAAEVGGMKSQVRKTQISLLLMGKGYEGQ